MTKLSSSGTSRLDDVVVKCRKQEKNLYLKYYLSNQERLDLIQEVGDAGCLLFEYYIRMASFKEHWEITDDEAIRQFGWGQRKAQRTRQELTKAGWFRAVRFTYTDGRKGITYYLGKEAVAASRENANHP